MRRIVRMLLGFAVVTMAAKRGQRAKQVYVEEVAAGARPIEAVGTAVAAFVGLAPSTARVADEPTEQAPRRP